MTRLIGLRAQAVATTAQRADLRQRAFTLLKHHYDQLRRVVAFLRWDEGDADTIAPSLYAGRGKRKTDTPQAATPQIVTQSPAPGPNGLFMPATSVEQPHNAASGMPGGSPFIH